MITETCCCFAENCSALICQLRGLAFLIWSAQEPDLLQVHTVDLTVLPPSSIALLGSVCLKAAAPLQFSCLNPKPCFVGVTPCIHELGWYTHTHTHTHTHWCVCVCFFALRALPAPSLTHSLAYPWLLGGNSDLKQNLSFIKVS